MTHTEQHRERAAEIAGQFAAVTQRFVGVEEDRRRIDELTFRIGATEEGRAERLRRRCSFRGPSTRRIRTSA